MPAERTLSSSLGSFRVEGPAGSRGRPTCEACRQRKVRCNRKLPCSNCSRLQLSCDYAKLSRRAPIRAPSRVSPPPSPETTPLSAAEVSAGEPSNADVLGRLENVESLLKNLVAQLGSHGLPSNQTRERRASTSQSSSAHELLIGDGERGDYVDDSMFVNVLLDDSARRRGTRSPPVPTSLAAHYPSQPYGIVSTDIFGLEMDDLCIPPQTFETLWTLYTQNVDPCTKLLHIPTTQSIIPRPGASPRPSTDTSRALSYAICFAAVASVPKSEAAELLGFEKLALLRHFMCQLDSALMKARMLIYPNVQCLQAFVIYLTALRTHDTGRSIWVLVGIAIRLAETLGVHQYGTNLGLSPFETEMRCRLWWHLTTLDAGAREGNGFNTCLIDKDQTFRPPLNVNDADLHPTMPALPAPRTGWTESTFPRAHLEITRRLRQAAASSRWKDAPATDAAIADVEASIWTQYLSAAPSSPQPIHRAATALAAVSIAKARFVLSFQSWLSASKASPPRYAQLPQAVFLAAVELLETGAVLQAGGGFAWFFQQHPHLHAFFLVLHVLKDSPGREGVERAWAAVEGYFVCIEDFVAAGRNKQRKSCLWAVLGRLAEQARAARGRVGGVGVSAAEAAAAEASSEVAEMGVADGGGLEVGTAGDAGEFAAAFDGQAGDALAALGTLDFDGMLALKDFEDWFDAEQLGV